MAMAATPSNLRVRAGRRGLLPSGRAPAHGDRRQRREFQHAVAVTSRRHTSVDFRVLRWSYCAGVNPRRTHDFSQLCSIWRTVNRREIFTPLIGVQSRPLSSMM
jgi:hypothetical protein